MCERLFSVVQLHEYPELIEQCCDILNEEWKRSRAARLHSLEKSSNDFPKSLVLLECNNSVTKAIGHSRLCRVLEDEKACWIESVVICKGRRGEGLGKLLMIRTEEHAKMLGYTTAYLSTHDQQGFYEHLGYTYCHPVSGIGCSLNSGFFESMNSYHQMANGEPSRNLPFPSQNENSKTTSFSYNSSFSSSNSVTSKQQHPPLPPPPPPPLSNCLQLKNLSDFKSQTGQVWMKKKLQSTSN